MNRQTRGSSEGFRSSNPNENNCFNNRHRQENWRENRNNERYANNSRSQREFNRFENQGFANNRRFEGRRQGGQSDQRFHNQGSRQSGPRNSTFRGQNERSRHLNFLSDRCEYGGNRSRGTENPPVSDHRPIKVSSIRMTPVELPYVPILLNETFITALWDTGAEKSFISEEVYRKYFSYRPRQKTKDRVVTAQGAPCSHFGRVELQIRIRKFQKPWELHILDNMQYQCILGIDFMKASRLTLDFDQKSLIIPDNQIKQLPKIEKLVDIDLADTKLDAGQQRLLKALFNNFKGLFSNQPGLTHVLYQEIDTGDKGPVVSRPYRYDRIKQGIIDYHIDKMLRDGTICPINSPYASPVVLTRKKNDLPPDSPEAYRFAIDYRELNGITKYPRYPLPVIDDLLTNIPHTGVMSTLDLRSGYFQLAISPKDIEKTAFITRNGTFEFLRMPFGLSGAAPNFQRAIDIILKPVIGRFVLVYMDDVIITSPSFKDHLDHLSQVSTLLRDAGLTLNKEKCHFARDKLQYLGLIISKDGIETDSNKIRAITEMRPPKNNREVSKFLGMMGWYQKFIPRYADICEPLYQLKKKKAKFNWSGEAQDSFDQIKLTLTEAPILQLPNFSEQFNLFTDASGSELVLCINKIKNLSLSRLEPLIKQKVIIRLPKENVWQ
ncbi:retrovirus-related Pol polyprotein from transposon 297 [Trichonephila clavipes]|nr:retrovirus-related Pol polyprotein from transposon 297 [Trichonephila clavipes]